MHRIACEGLDPLAWAESGLRGKRDNSLELAALAVEARDKGVEDAVAAGPAKLAVQVVFAVFPHSTDDGHGSPKVVDGDAAALLKIGLALRETVGLHNLVGRQNLDGEEGERARERRQRGKKQKFQPFVQRRIVTVKGEKPFAVRQVEALCELVSIAVETV